MAEANRVHSSEGVGLREVPGAGFAATRDDKGVGVAHLRKPQWMGLARRARVEDNAGRRGIACPTVRELEPSGASPQNQRRQTSERD
jgi:hypothetical protein